MEFAARVRAEADQLALLDTLDSGNPLTAMRADVTKGVRLMGDAAGVALQIKGETFPLPGLHYTQREPWGVVGRMVTFNHPVMFTCARLATALVAGNCVVIKPSELAPLGAARGRRADRGPLPGWRRVRGAPAGRPPARRWCATHSVQRLTFTGSTATALRIQAAAADSGHVKTLTFELGGKNPIVVFPDVGCRRGRGRHRAGHELHPRPGPELRFHQPARHPSRRSRTRCWSVSPTRGGGHPHRAAAWTQTPRWAR